MWATKQKGFTIVELLIVIVVIAILAAITIVAYNGIQTRARNTQAASDEVSLKKSMQLYKTQTGELPPLGDAWNYNTSPPDCSKWTATIAAIDSQSAGAGNLPTKDPWGNCYGYDDNDCNSGSVAGSPSYIKSYGPDGVAGGGDDIQIMVSSGC